MRKAGIINDDELLRLASLSLAIDAEDHPEAAGFARDLAKLSREEHVAVVMLSKLLAGNSFGVSSDRPALINRMKALAAHIGAEVLAVEEEGEGTLIAFKPPPRQ